MKAGLINSPSNGSEKRKFTRVTTHDQDQEYYFMILRPSECSFCKYPKLH